MKEVFLLLNQRVPVVPLFVVCLLLVFALSACGAKPTADVTKIVLGFVPSVEAATKADTADPLGQLLAAELGPGYEVEAIVSADFSGLAEAMGAGQVDVGFLHSFTYVLAHDEYGIELGLKVVRGGSDSYQAQFITRTDSDITDIADLRGRKVGYVDAASTSGYLFPAVAMTELGIDPMTDVQPFFLGSHDNVVFAVRDGDVDAGVTFDAALDRVLPDDPEIHDKVHRIALTDPIPNDTISFRPHLPDDVKEALMAAFERLVETEEGAELLQKAYRIDGFARGNDSDYDIVRAAAEWLP